jgi:hypothetical protein
MAGKAKSENRCIHPACFRRRTPGTDRCPGHQTWDASYAPLIPPRTRKRAKRWTIPEPELLPEPRPKSKMDLVRWAEQDLRFADNIRWWCAQQNQDPVFTQWCVDTELAHHQAAREATIGSILD